MADEDKSSLRRLEATPDALSTAADSSADLSHPGVPFGDLAAQKLRLGIAPVIQGLHHRAAANRLVLENLRPSAVFSDGSHLDDALPSELCRTMGIPAVMVSHGSHPPPSSEAEYYELGEHGRHLINAPYPFTALQSPVAEEFREVFPTRSTGLRTGPLIWVARPDKERSTTLRNRLLGTTDQDRVIVHAGTPKRKRGLRFHGNETFDEYVQSLQDLVAAVERVPNTRLIVKFRPLPRLSVDDLRALVGFSDKALLSVDEPLMDVLGFADLLVSFSSTVIEETLQNRIPVLLYGGAGRYQHVRATTIGSADSPGPSAVFHVKDAGGLSYALRYMLNTCGPHQLGDEHFAPYVYPAEQVSGDRVLIRVERDGSVQELRTVDAGGSQTIREADASPCNCYVLLSRRFFNPYFGTGQQDREQYVRDHGLPNTRSSATNDFSQRLFNALRHRDDFNRVLQRAVNPPPI